MAKVVCESCGTSFLYNVVKELENCPVCGKPLWSQDDSEDKDGHSNWITWYYYGYKCDNGKTACLEDSPIDLSEHGDTFFLIKEFKAPPELECGLDEVKRILRTYIPDAFSEPKDTKPSICCPKCGSQEFTLLNRGYSIFTGFLGSGKVKRVCNRCKKEF